MRLNEAAELVASTELCPWMTEFHGVANLESLLLNLATFQLSKATFYHQRRLIVPLLDFSFYQGTNFEQRWV